MQILSQIIFAEVFISDNECYGHSLEIFVCIFNCCSLYICDEVLFDKIIYLSSIISLSIFVNN